MNSFTARDLSISFPVEGAREYSKVSYPVQYGILCEIESRDYIYQFYPSGEIKYIRSKNTVWPGDEWLKRTAGNDWIYYTPGIYTGLYSYIGEYYLPCFEYPTNSIFSYKPFKNPAVKEAIRSLDTLCHDCAVLHDNGAGPDIQSICNSISKCTGGFLRKRASAFHDIIGGPVNVLPPDARHVDYDVIPVSISTGCLYNCTFCTVKDGRDFHPRSEDEIATQIRSLKDYFGKDMSNYNSIFLGNNDALAAGSSLIDFAAARAYDEFNLGSSYMSGCNLFLFGSLDSFMNMKDSFFSMLNRGPYYTYINIGFESADEGTLEKLAKPLSPEKISGAFARMIDLNRMFDKVEITGNFLFSGEFTEDHLLSIVDLANGICRNRYSKGGLYLSPLAPSSTEESSIQLQRKFIQIKQKLHLPAHLYIIQRL